ncbi:hypothetical protein HCN44_001097 [Aphidius gifuensis]|uniref:Uncharacterized protein n=1 Tax=Aphidius gifuensis TaxID=684658 RepID=A0A834XNK4_APHGI|nr:hypothetical protein HCN44_001097 [Aphidius gifuensis]
MDRHINRLIIPESSEKSLTRAISYSDLATSRRFFFQQSENSNGLIKQYSCEQIFDKETKLRHIKVSTTIKPSQQNSLTCWRPNVNRFDSVESPGCYNNITDKNFDDVTDKLLPMIELDGLKISDEPITNKSTILSHKKSKSDNIHDIVDILPQKLQLNTINKQKKNNYQNDNLESSIIDKKITNIDKTKFKINKKTLTLYKNNKKMLMKILFFCLIIIASVLTSNFISDLTSKPFNFKNSTIELRNNVYGQFEAVEKIINYVDNNLNNFTVITIIGGTGVGKTLTASIIKNNFPFKQYIFEYYSPLNQKLFPSLSFFYCNLIILDNLRNTDLPVMINFIKYWQDQENKPCTMILAIFNPEETNNNLEKIINLENSQMNMQKIFNNENIQSEIVVYKPLDDDTLDKCIEKEASLIKTQLTFQQLQDIRSHLITAQSGCKGAHAKVALVA